MLYRTLTTNKKVEVKPDAIICVTDDASMAGIYDNLIVIDCKHFAGKLRKGDKITVNYGVIELDVIGFEDKQTYIERNK